MFAALSSSAAQAADYYVDVNGDNAGLGTIADPWRTLSKVSGTSFLPGDRIFLQGGQTFNGRLAFGIDDAATAANPITVSSYGTGRATISSGLNEGIYVRDLGGFEISNLNLVGAGRGSSMKNGVFFLYNPSGPSSRLDHVYIDNVEVSGYRNGISIAGYVGLFSGKAGYNDVRITNSVARDNASSGIIIWSFQGVAGYGHSNVYIGNTRAHDNYFATRTPKEDENGILVSNVDGATIETSLTYNNGALGDGGVGTWTYESNNVVMQFCESYNNRTGGAHDGGGFDLDGGVTNSVMQYNYSHDNDGPGYLLAQYRGARPFHNNIVRYNVSENDGRKHGSGAIDFWSDKLNGTNNVRDTVVHNNTIYVSPAPSGTARAVRVIEGTGTTNVRVLNNVFVTTSGVPLVFSEATNNPTFQGNNYWSSRGAFAITWGNTTYTSLSAWRSATGQEMNGTTVTGTDVDPILTSPGNGGTIGNPANLVNLTAYQLQSTSPLIDSGLNLTAAPWSLNVGSSDYFNNALPQGSGYDVGAHEFVAAPTPPTPDVTN
ncbi:MAG TPA: hypothetical protein VK427_26515 [Kofleriaceae bacterium]|nr:hypothetical protein [Kofleriaceae bacterium]